MFSTKKINQIYPGKRADNFLENERLRHYLFQVSITNLVEGKDMFFKPIIFLLPQERPIKGSPSYKRSK